MIDVAAKDKWRYNKKKVSLLSWHPLVTCNDVKFEPCADVSKHWWEFE